MASIKQCFKNLASKGIEVPELEDDSEFNIKEKGDNEDVIQVKYEEEQLP